MADTALEAAAETDFDQQVAPRWVCSPAEDVAYCVFLGATNEVRYRKLSGRSWANAVEVNSGTSVRLDIWYDRWTKNVTTTKLLMAFVEVGVDDGLFNALDLSDDSLDGEAIAFAGASATTTGTNDATKGSIVRAESGRIYALFDIDTGTEVAFCFSDDNGATWDSTLDATVYEASGDRMLLLPGNEADLDDIYCLYYDESTGELTLKVYDATGDTWSESAAILSGLATTLLAFQYPMDAAQRHSDGHIIAVCATAQDVGTADLKVVDITNATTFSTLTDVITDADDWYAPAIFIDNSGGPGTDDIYVSYVGKDDGSEAYGATVSCNYQLSQDGGSSWDGEVAMSVDALDDHRHVSVDKGATPDGGTFLPIWFNTDLNDLVCNLDNAIGFAGTLATTGAAGVGYYPIRRHRRRIQ